MTTKNSIRAPHNPVRSPKFDTPIGYNCRRHKANTGFISKAKNVSRWLDIGSQESNTVLKPKKEVKQHESIPFHMKVENGKVKWLKRNSKFVSKTLIGSLSILGITQDGLYTV